MTGGSSFWTERAGEVSLRMGSWGGTGHVAGGRAGRLGGEQLQRPEAGVGLAADGRHGGASAAGVRCGKAGATAGDTQPAEVDGGQHGISQGGVMLAAGTSSSQNSEVQCDQSLFLVAACGCRGLSVFEAHGLLRSHDPALLGGLVPGALHWILVSGRKKRRKGSWGTVR